MPKPVKLVFKIDLSTHPCPHWAVCEAVKIIDSYSKSSVPPVRYRYSPEVLEREAAYLLIEHYRNHQTFVSWDVVFPHEGKSRSASELASKAGILIMPAKDVEE